MLNLTHILPSRRAGKTVAVAQSMAVTPSAAAAVLASVAHNQQRQHVLAMARHLRALCGLDPDPRLGEPIPKSLSIAQRRRVAAALKDATYFLALDGIQPATVMDVIIAAHGARLRDTGVTSTFSLGGISISNTGCDKRLMLDGWMKKATAALAQPE
ncbi:hypothetical protein EOE18_13680 [Novosphingobium umbonatum]|uniref:Uncharacterized protein n=1 Tax=Novosphingobium umbonatum TaxID=1908524 RepID=A0A3S3TLP2_9SPHN|nr:hypothetical protein [Novosphingobium umbonatum]RVU03905.1 hypothetical protein EOE18_13680 [Novosphingobium umbonatum]